MIFILTKTFFSKKVFENHKISENDKILPILVDFHLMILLKSYIKDKYQL